MEHLGRECTSKKINHIKIGKYEKISRYWIDRSCCNGREFGSEYGKQRLYGSCFQPDSFKVDEFVNGRAKGKNIIGTHSLRGTGGFVESTSQSDVNGKAGQPVDDFIEKLIPLLEPGDIIIDGEIVTLWTHAVAPNTLKVKDCYILEQAFPGREGALRGPSMMPGGSPAAWPHVKDIFQAIAAKVDDGTPCCDWVGEDGAGHFVKMVHNGIEYGDMQIINEAYHLMKELLGMTPDEQHEVFKNGMKANSILT